MQKRISWEERVLLIWIFVLIMGHGILGLGITKISGNSMASTLEDGDFIFVATVHDCTTLERDDVITFRPNQSSSRTFIKRVVGLPGETIEARGDLLFVNGTSNGVSNPGTGTWGPVTIPKDAVFVLGDNRAASNDSRIFGCVPFKQICSKMLSDCRRK